MKEIFSYDVMPYPSKFFLQTHPDRLATLATFFGMTPAKIENCRVLESSRVGNKLTYKMACTGEEAMTVSGEMTYAGTSYEGRMRMITQSSGQSMEMGQTFAGKRVGDCTAAK